MRKQSWEVFILAQLTIILWNTNIICTEMNITNYENMLMELMDNDLKSKEIPREIGKYETEFSGDEHSIKCISTASRTCRKIEELEGSTFDVSTTDMADLCDCHCNVGYYEANKTCIKIIAFRGGLIFHKANQTNFQNLSSAAESYLKEAYGSKAGFTTVLVKELSGTFSGNQLIFELLFNANAHFNDKTVMDEFQSSCEKSPTAGNFTINCNQSLSFIEGEIRKCGSVYENYCDHRTTICHVSNGEVYCECDGRSFNFNPHFTSCSEQVCHENEECSPPFGRCIKMEKSANVCSCFWGFYGEQCENANMFILTVAIATILLLIIIVLICRCARKGRKKDTFNKSRDSTFDVLETLANISEVQFDYEPSRMRARIPDSSTTFHKTTHHHHHHRPPSTSPSTSTFSIAAQRSQTHTSARVAGSSCGHQYTNQSFVGNMKHARAQMNKDIKRADYF